MPAMQEREAESAPAPIPVRHRRSFPLYVGSGGVATASHYVVTIAAVEAFGVAPIVATMLGFATGSVVKYGLNYSLAFQSRVRHTRAVVRFTIALAALFAANTLLFALLQSGMGMHYIVAQAITTIALIPPGYLLHRQWVFR